MIGFSTGNSAPPIPKKVRYRYRWVIGMWRLVNEDDGFSGWPYWLQ